MNVELLLKARVNGKEVTVDVDQNIASESVSQFVSNHCEELNKKVSELVVQEEDAPEQESKPSEETKGVEEAEPEDKKEEATA